MNKVILIFIAFIAINFSTSAQNLKDIKKAAKKVVNESSSTKLTDEEVGKALKEALNIGIEKGVKQLSKPDGYLKDLEIKILMPKEAKTVEEKLRSIGQGKMVDDAIESMNRAAEDAANGAKDIFVNAIKELTLKDVMNILHGENDAATRYLENQTRDQLIEKFKPVIKVSLEKVGATKYWKTVFSTYNKIPLVKKVDPDLVSHVTKKAIDGLFIQIAKQELEIRKNSGARITDLLKKVFGS